MAKGQAVNWARLVLFSFRGSSGHDHLSALGVAVRANSISIHWKLAQIFRFSDNAHRVTQ